MVRRAETKSSPSTGPARSDLLPYSADDTSGFPAETKHGDERQIFFDPQETAEAWRALGVRLAGYRKEAGYTQAAFAPQTFYGRSTVANVERGRQHIGREFWSRCDSVLKTDGLLTAEYDRISRAASRQRIAAARQSDEHARSNFDKSTWYTDLTTGDIQGGEANTNRRDVLTIPLVLACAARTSREIAQADPDPLTVTEIEDDIERIAADYATTMHGEMLAFVEQRWTQVDRALAGRTSLVVRGRLTRSAAQLSYFLSRLAFNCGELNSARQIAVLAEQYARQVDERVILSSVAGLRSSIAYYRGRYEEAVSVFSGYPSDPRYLTARNAAYRARAYARIGNEAEAMAQLEHMWRATTDVPATPGDLPLDDAAASMFAGWTFAFLGEGDRAEDFARQSVNTYTEMGSQASREEWAHALLMLSYSLLNRKHPVVDEAATAATSAIEVIRQYPTHTAMQRAEDFATSLHHYRNTPAVRTLHDRMKSLAQPAAIRA